MIVQFKNYQEVREYVKKEVRCKFCNHPTVFGGDTIKSIATTDIAAYIANIQEEWQKEVLLSLVI
ncbi:hypothetical protein [Lachnoclostridium phytofermentans]|uniref:hypothetical protein n=1 Tax=Lachnoclostridium phytofermentans TaxID=66219 RepID=UPI000308C481|nr:hypothetical protein [Lachnoclostridium phytofermentans]